MPLEVRRVSTTTSTAGTTRRQMMMKTTAAPTEFRATLQETRERAPVRVERFTAGASPDDAAREEALQVSLTVVLVVRDPLDRLVSLFPAWQATRNGSVTAAGEPKDRVGWLEWLGHGGGVEDRRRKGPIPRRVRRRRTSGRAGGGWLGRKGEPNHDQ